MRKRGCRLLSVLCGVFMLAGCGSARFNSTLKPAGNPQLTVADQRFRLADFQVSYGEERMMYPVVPQQVISRAGVLYPRIFANDWSAVPITVATQVDDEGMGKLGPILTGFTLGLIPFPSHHLVNYQVVVSLVDEQGDKVPVAPVSFSRENALWMTLIGPLGCLPVPGETLVPRDTVFFNLSGEEMAQKSTGLTNDSLVEAVVSALRQAPAERMTAIAKARQARMKEVTIEGVPYWSFLTPAFSKGFDKQERADQFVVLLYRERPRPDLQPLESAVVAKRDTNGRWQPVPAYLKRTTKGLVSISALLEGGAPSRVIATEVSEPPLEDFVPLPAGVADDRETAEALRWSNRILLQAKNRTLPALLKVKATGELVDLVTQVENSFLDLNRMSELAKDRGQKSVADGADGGAARELSLTCRERVDILRPILAAIKQEIAGRGGK